MNPSPKADQPQPAIAKAISVLITRHAKTQGWLAGQLDRSQPWLSARMTGRTPMTTDDIANIATAFGISYWELNRLAELELEAVA